MQLWQEFTLCMGGRSQQPRPGAQPVPGRAGGAWEHRGMRPHEEDPMQPTAFAVTHLPHPKKKKLLSSLVQGCPGLRSFLSVQVDAQLLPLPG